MNRPEIICCGLRACVGFESQTVLELRLFRDVLEQSAGLYVRRCGCKDDTAKNELLLVDQLLKIDASLSYGWVGEAFLEVAHIINLRDVREYKR